MSTPKGYSTQEKDDRLKAEFATVQPTGEKRFGLDVVASMYHHIINNGDTINAVPTEGNGDVISLTINGHGAKKGDLLYFKDGNQVNRQIRVWEVTDANNIVLAETILSTESLPEVGDEIDILTPIMPRSNSEGDVILSAEPLKINVDEGAGPVATTVLDDQDDASNSVPIPVKLYGVTGDVNITAGDLNVQLSHSAASFDSTRIGDGSETVAVNASNEFQVRDDDANTSLTAIAGAVSGSEIQVDIVNIAGISTESTLSALSAKLPATLGEKADSASLSVTLSTQNEALLSSMDTDLSTLSGAVSGSELQVDLVGIAGVATEASLSSLNGKFNSLGKKASSASAPVVLSSEQETILNAVKTSVELLDNAISGSEMQVDLVDIGGVATEVSLAAMSAKLPAALGQQNKAGSMSVAMASDQDPLNTNLTPVDFLDSGLVDTSSSNIPTGSNLAIVSSLASNVKKIQIIEDIGEFISLRNTGGTVLAYLPLGGGEIEVAISSSTGLGLRSESGSTISSGKIAINFLG